jgi:hypothetical protein
MIVIPSLRGKSGNIGSMTLLAKNHINQLGNRRKRIEHPTALRIPSSAAKHHP